MIKTVRIPAQNLACPEQIYFIELFLQPCLQSDDCFHEIADGPLSLAVAIARKATAYLPKISNPSRVRLMTSGLNLSVTKGIILALALCPFLLRVDCLYPHYIIIGTLALVSGKFIILPDNPENLFLKLKAIAELGYQTQPTLLVLPKMPWDLATVQIINKLSGNNVAVRTATDLQQAYNACLGYGGQLGEAS